MNKLLFALLFLAMAFGGPAHAVPLDPADIGEGLFRKFFDREGVIPTCDHPGVGSKIQKRFNRFTDPNVLERGLVLERIDRIVEARYEVDDPSPLARRYCKAEAFFNDQRHRHLYYFITEHGGFVGVRWNVEFCVAGLDPWMVYDGRCRVARPQ